jgi:hypothetical protein
VIGGLRAIYMGEGEGRNLVETFNKLLAGFGDAPDNPHHETSYASPHTMMHSALRPFTIESQQPRYDRLPIPRVVACKLVTVALVRFECAGHEGEHAGNEEEGTRERRGGECVSSKADELKEVVRHGDELKHATLRDAMARGAAQVRCARVHGAEACERCVVDRVSQLTHNK